MKCSVFIATSADGYIADVNDGVDWLDNAGKPDADMESFSDMGFNDFLATIDCIIMGRKCMEKISSFNLTPDQWPYGDIPIFVLSNTVQHCPDNMKEKVSIHSDGILALFSLLSAKNLNHAYIDGGVTITSFLNEKLINEMTITQAPILLGGGVSLFGELKYPIKLEKSKVRAFPNDFIQVRYKVSYL